MTEFALPAIVFGLLTTIIIRAEWILPVFIVNAAGHYLSARPVIVINKFDLSPDPASLAEEISPVSSDIDDTFSEIPELAEGYRISYCRHEREAVRNGTLTASRLENYHRLMRELAFEQDNEEIGVARTERKRWKGITKLG